MALLFALAAGCAPLPESERRPARDAISEPSPEMTARATSGFETVRRGFLAWYFEEHPVRATELGVHTYDDRLPDMGRAAQQRRIDAVLDWLADLEAIEPAHLEGDDRYDHAILEFTLRGALLDLEEKRSWARDPRLYTELIAAGIASLAEGAGPDAVEALESRMSAAPGVLSAARANLSAAPRLWTERAMAGTRALITHLEQEPWPGAAVGGAAGGSGSGGSLDEARERLVAALREHLGWLETTLLPAASGDYRLGRYLFERQLLYDEHLAISATELDRLNATAIGELQAEVERAAAELDPDRSPGEILDSLSAVHPAQENLVGTASEMVESLFAWTWQGGRVTARGETAPTVPVVRPAPVHARDHLAFAAAPGPLEEADWPATVYLATEPPAWSHAEGEAYLRYFSYGELLGLAINHGFPGRLLQRAFARRAPGELRSAFGSRTLADGWAGYAERLTLEGDYAAGDPATRLALLRRALHAQARWYASVHIHALDTPFDDVVDRFMEIAYVPESRALREVQRATYDPMYLAGGLGTLQILELRKDYRAALEGRGESFSRARFHDRLLGLALPVPLAREVLIPMERSTPTAGQRRPR